MTYPRIQVAAALLFLSCAGLAGISPLRAGVRYELFGLTEGLIAILFTYLLIARRAWPDPTWPLGWIATGYGTLATAQALHMLLPPPGVVQWIAVIGIVFAVWAAMSGSSARGVIMMIATLAIILALLKFSVIPFVWERAGPSPGAVFGLGDLAESFRRLFVEYEVVSPAGQIYGFLALTGWAAGTRVLWSSDPEERGRKRPVSGE